MGAVCRFGEPGPDDGRASGPAADHSSYGSFAPFSDPDGNGWLLQEVTTRLPGRVDPGATSFGSASDLASALRRAAAAARGEHEKRPREASTRSEHEKRAREASTRSEHEKRLGERDANWPEWYAAYMAAEHAGAELPS
jgi:hypothetical protein